MTHDLIDLHHCSLFDSPHANADHYYIPTCSCGWKSIAVQGKANAIALHTAHKAAQAQWHPVSEPVPADGWYLVLLDKPLLGARVHTGRFQDGAPATVATVFVHDVQDKKVTHWMPLPALP